MTRSRIGLAAAVACLLSGISSAAAAQETSAAAFVRAAMALDQRLGPIETGPLVAATDSAANASDIATIERAMAAFATPAFPVDGFTTFERVCEPLNRLSVRHALDGASALRRPAGAAPPNAQETAAITAQLQALRQQNAVRHQDAMIILSTSSTRCTVAHFPVLAQFLAGLPSAELTPVRIGGVTQMRLGIAQTLFGAATALRQDGTSAANRGRLLALINDLATPFSRALTPELRREFQTALQGLPATTDAQTLAATAALSAALRDEGCAELCLVR